MRSRSMSSVAAIAGLALTALALGHELTYLLAHGTDGLAAAMTERGHDRYWSSFLTVVVLVAGILLTIAVLQLRRLRRLADLVRANRQVQVPDMGARRLLELFAPLWWRVSIVVLLAFFVQENAEVGAIGARLPLLGVFAGEHWVALPVLIAASALVAFVGALFRWRRDVLLRQLRLAVRFRRATGAARPRSGAAQPKSAVSPRRHGVRAPPCGAVAFA